MILSSSEGSATRNRIFGYQDSAQKWAYGKFNNVFFGMLFFDIFHNENIKKNFLKSISSFQKMKSWFRVLDRSSLLGSQIVNYFCIKQQFEFFSVFAKCMNLKVSFKIGAKIKITYLLKIDLFEILQIRTCANI